MLVHKVEMVEACRGGTLRLRDSLRNDAKARSIWLL